MTHSESATSFARNPDEATLVTSDLPNFWRAMDRAEPGQLAAALERYYFGPASPGLFAFIDKRIESADLLAAAVEQHRDHYDGLRAITERIDKACGAMRQVYGRMADLYDDALFPDTYLLIGRLTCGGTICEHGSLVGLELFAGSDVQDDRAFHESGHHPPMSIASLPLMLAHELVHFQQRLVRRELRSEVDESEHTLLACVLCEGVAEFVGELISGGHVNGHIHAWAAPRERELWQRFREQMHSQELADWLYNRRHVKDQPGDLGYYIGYRIAQAYYNLASDKRTAVAGLLEVDDPGEILEASGYGSRW